VLSQVQVCRLLASKHLCVLSTPMVLLLLCPNMQAPTQAGTNISGGQRGAGPAAHVLVPRRAIRLLDDLPDDDVRGLLHLLTWLQSQAGLLGLRAGQYAGWSGQRQQQRACLACGGAQGSIWPTHTTALQSCWYTAPRCHSAAAQLAAYGWLGCLPLRVQAVACCTRTMLHSTLHGCSCSAAPAARPPHQVVKGYEDLLLVGGHLGARGGHLVHHLLQVRLWGAGAGAREVRQGARPVVAPTSCRS
jgi:hypothetical protein